MTKTFREISQYYEEAEFNFSTAQTGVLLSTLGTTFLSKFGPSSSSNACYPRFPSRIVIRTNQTISVSLTPRTGNTVAVNDYITVASTDVPFTIDGVEFGDVLITNNSGQTAAIKLFISDSQY